MTQTNGSPGFPGRFTLVGLSGVGKSTLLKKVGKRVSFLHLQASHLIQNELVFQTSVTQTSEQLRNGPIINNQAHLISAFQRKRRRVMG